MSEKVFTEVLCVTEHVSMVLNKHPLASNLEAKIVTASLKELFEDWTFHIQKLEKVGLQMSEVVIVFIQFEQLQHEFYAFVRVIVLNQLNQR